MGTPPVQGVFAYRGLVYIQTRSVARHFGVSIEPHEAEVLSRRSRIVLMVVGAALIALWLYAMLFA